jgi:hypothetical protein
VPKKHGRQAFFVLPPQRAMPKELASCVEIPEKNCKLSRLDGPFGALGQPARRHLTTRPPMQAVQPASWPPRPPMIEYTGASLAMATE